MFDKLFIKPSQMVLYHTRNMSGHHGPRIFVITPSRWQWTKTKDLTLYYMWIGIIFCCSIITGANVFIGPAQLEPIPDDYVPRHYEYFRNPITRFLARYVCSNPQQEYEKMMHNLYEEQEMQFIRKLEKNIRALMAERNDYKAWYYRPALAKYHRASKEAAEYLKAIRGD